MFEKFNGLIVYYQIERCINGILNIIMVIKVFFEVKQQYVDDMSELFFFIVYDYRVIVVNGVGSLGLYWSIVIIKFLSKIYVLYFFLFFLIFFMLNYYCNILIVL